MQDFEKLGVFYLGREVDPDTGETSQLPLLYDSRDLTTHAVAVGMTGSGKTGLCLDLLEEAGMDQVPAIVIDPKGDIANLLLTFPELSAAEFRPWIDESQAVREGQSPDEFAEKEAAKWKEGLESWGQSGDRIRRFREKVDLQVFTPGSKTGRPVAILKSFAAPPQEVIDNADAFQERVQAAVSGLLALVGIEADPIRSREHILLSHLLSNAWSDSQDVSLGGLIQKIQNPGIEKIGVMELDTVFPPSDRLELAMTMNNLLASPSFSSWLEGEPLDIDRLLHDEAGKPRISIMSISHLSDSERMFFVTILLNEILSWMRKQAGTSSLRALLYMDEVFGFFPPVANPPSKKPMLTMLKQARAFGLGVVLATQNPVDLDYKGLSNTGTWFLGRLQTERDKARVLEGLEGVAATTGASFDRREMEQILAGLGSRKFLMNNVHEDGPVVFETRWAMSYLRGPLTLNQIGELAGKPETAGEPAPPTDASPLANAANQSVNPPMEEPVTVKPTSERQSLPEAIPQLFAQVHGDLLNERFVYRPAILATGRLHFERVKYQVDAWDERTFMVQVPGAKLADDLWDRCAPVEGMLDVHGQPIEGVEFSDYPSELQESKFWASQERDFCDYLYQSQRLPIYYCKALKTYSFALETRGEFLVRLKQLAAEQRDLDMEKIRHDNAKKFDALRDRIRKAEQKMDEEASQYKHRRFDSILSTGSSVLGAILGRKTFSSTNARRAGSSMRSFGRVSKERRDMVRAQEKLADLQEDFEALEQQVASDLEQVKSEWDVDDLVLEEFAVKCRKGELQVEHLGLVWLPYRVDSDENFVTAF